MGGAWSGYHQSSESTGLSASALRVRTTFPLATTVLTPIPKRCPSGANVSHSLSNTAALPWEFLVVSWQQSASTARSRRSWLAGLGRLAGVGRLARVGRLAGVGCGGLLIGGRIFWWAVLSSKGFGHCGNGGFVDLFAVEQVAEYHCHTAADGERTVVSLLAD